MNLTRRSWLAGTACSVGLAGAWALNRNGRGPIAGSLFRPTKMSGTVVPATFSITPVVSDGKWNWSEQPIDQTGYLDPREFDVRVGMRWRSDGIARNLRGSTVVPVAFPEQQFSDWRIDKPDNCEAIVVPLSQSAAQLQLAAPVIGRGETITVSVTSKIRLFRYCPHFSAEQFPHTQEIPEEIANMGLGNSPGIRSEMQGVRELAKSIVSRHDHPWNRARQFFDWVWENIQGRPGPYTSVQTAIREKQGDCEERAGVFIALCRADGIPSRLVLVPNHCWAEFCLLDEKGTAHWIPAHTAAYNWFGWTGAHELILQKGDRIFQPGKEKNMRLIADWYSFAGRRPIIEYFGELTPLEGPGKRVKNSRGGWDLVGDDPDNRFVRG